MHFLLLRVFDNLKYWICYVISMKRMCFEISLIENTVSNWISMAHDHRNIPITIIFAILGWPNTIYLNKQLWYSASNQLNLMCILQAQTITERKEILFSLHLHKCTIGKWWKEEGMFDQTSKTLICNQLLISMLRKSINKYNEFYSTNPVFRCIWELININFVFLAFWK
jgi:hypothetical protein